MKEVTAMLKNVGISSKKVDPIIKNLRGKKALEAYEALQFLPKKASIPLAKMIKSAVANAKNNFNMKEDKLVIKEITVSKGQTLKRFRPVSRGTAHQILKRTSHLKVVLEEA